MTAILGGLVCISVALATLVVGLSTVDRSGLKRPRPSTQPPARAATPSAPAFTPLELSPVALNWPSERPAEAPRLAPLRWPSETWTDNFFSRAGSPSVPTSSESGPSSLKPSEPKPKKKRRSEPRPVEVTAPAVAIPVEEPVPIATEAVGPIPPEQVLAWAREHGLAVAVEHIRQQTGWDFQRAAKYLAAVLRESKERS